MAGTIPDVLAVLALLAALAWFVPRLVSRLRLSRAKHPTLAGHARMSRRAARLLPGYELSQRRFFDVDGAPPAIADARRSAFERLAAHYAPHRSEAIDAADELEARLPDLAFTRRYRVPFPFSRLVRERLRLGAFAVETHGPLVRDPDGNEAMDLTGSYGVNLFGHEFYKACLADASERARSLGPLLGPYHPCVRNNVERLCELSGLDAVSFHMSGTEAVMQAVRLARYHTRRRKVVTFCGAYHGWWDGVQPGVGNPVGSSDLFMLSELSDRTLRVLETRRDIACVLVNPLQALAPNKPAAGDSTLVSNGRQARFDKDAYRTWLQALRRVCTERGIVLILDEVFLGFRLGRRGAQGFFDVSADMVTYGKTLGGGLPVGVVCGHAALMRRYREDAPADICFARGTFNAHPMVMAAMDAFLTRIEQPEIAALWDGMEDRWDARRSALNARLAEAGLPIRLEGMVSVWTVIYERPSRYNWMLQFYLRREGLQLPWIGTGRFIFSEDYDDERFEEVAERILRAARAMDADGWWWTGPRSVRRQLLGELLAAPRRSDTAATVRP